MKYQEILGEVWAECSSDPFWKSIVLTKTLHNSSKRDHPRFIFSAFDRITNLKYVVKMIFCEEKTLPEVEILSSLSHKNIIGFEKVSRIRNSWWVLCMKEAKGSDLVELLEKNIRICEYRTKRIFFQVFEGLKYLHSQKIIHGDVKLDNILLMEEEDYTSTNHPDDHVLLIDFEFSHKFHTGQDSIPTRTGTYLYSSPEGRFAGISGMEADMWAAGVTLYALLYGKFPFSIDTLKARQEVQTLNRDLENPTFPPCDSLNSQPSRCGCGCRCGCINASMSPSCKDLLRKLLCLNRTKRIKASEVLQHQWFSDLGLTKTKASTVSNLLSGLNINNEFHSYHHQHSSLVSHEEGDRLVSRRRRSVATLLSLSQKEENKTSPNPILEKRLSKEEPPEKKYISSKISLSTVNEISGSS